MTWLTNPDPWVVLFSKPGKRARYLRRVDVVKNVPVAAKSYAAAHRMSKSFAETIATNLRNRGYRASAHPVSGLPASGRMPFVGM